MIYHIQKFIKHIEHNPIFEPVLEHRGKNKGQVKHFKGIYSVNQYIKKHNLSDEYYIYVGYYKND
jgi:hypothetical protein